MRIGARPLLLAVALVVALPPSVLPQEASPVEALVGLARVKRDAGDLRAAVEYFEEAEGLRPLDTAETTEYFWCLAEVDIPRARELAGRLLKRRPSDADVRARAVAWAVEAGEELSARRLAGAGARQDPTTARWPRHIGESYLRQMRPGDAVWAFAQAVDQPDATTLDWASYAVALEAAGRPRDALDAWAQVSVADRSARDDWARSHLRAMAASTTPAAGAEAIETWLARHPEDRELRGTLVEIWARAGRPDLALRAIGPLTTDPVDTRWLRREGELAQASGDQARAIRAFDRLRRTDRAAPEVLWTLAELLVQAESFEQVADVIEAVSRTAPCDERALALTDRQPGPRGTHRLMQLLRRRQPSCPTDSSWLAHAATRAIALGWHDAALYLIEPYADTDPALRSWLGRLLLWTGHPARAAEVLESIVAEDGSPEVVDALIDAHRAIQHHARAWTLAQIRLEDPSLPWHRRRDLAELAIEADHPERALDLAESLEPEQPSQARQLAGQALLALGRPADALTSLRAAGAPRSPASTLALAEAVAAMEGPTRALAVVREAAVTDPDWVEVLARQGLWEARVGDRERAGALIDRTVTLNPRRASLLRAEIALADEQPAMAVAILGNLIETDPDGRATDLYATALAGTGDFEGADRRLTALRRRRPRHVPFALRQAEWRWRAQRAPDRLSALLELARVQSERADATSVAARALFDHGRFEDALAILGGHQETWQQQPIEGRITAARALRELGRDHEALELMVARPILTGPGALLQAQVTAAIEGPDAADALFADLAASERNGAAVYLAWSTVQPAPEAEAAVLEEGVDRYPGNVDLLSALAHAEATIGDWAAALAHADLAILLDGQRPEVWFIRVDATRRLTPEHVDVVLDDFYRVFHGESAVVIGMAERLAGEARSARDPVVVTALAWLDDLPSRDRSSLQGQLARARVLAASERWDQALEVVRKSVVAFPDSHPAHRLRADLLAFSGRHEAALAAYDAYLEDAALDLEAARLRARTLGWAGKYAASIRRYRALVASHPNAAAIVAEANAKEAYYEARWPDAVEWYRRWLDVEPTNREAAFELAQARLARGEVRMAEALLHQLDETPPVHRFASAAAGRIGRRRRPSVEAYASHRTADGYDGLRLLDVSEAGVLTTARFGRDLRTELGLSSGAIRARATADQRQGHRAFVFGSHRFSPSWAVEAKGGGLFFRQLGNPGFEGHGLVRWSPDHLWSVFAGAERVSVLENLVTVDTQLQGTGGFAGVALRSRQHSLDLAVARQALSDGNTRSSVMLSASRPLTAGANQLRLVGWGWYTTFDHQRSTYFSPSSFYRADGGVEWSWWLSSPRFPGDRVRRVTTSYLIGVDNDGALYHHPSLSFRFELPKGLALEAGATSILSDVYRETEAHIGVRVGVPSRTYR